MANCLENGYRYKPTSREYQRIREHYDLYNRLPKNIPDESRKKNSESTSKRNIEFWSNEDNRRKASESMKLAWIKRRAKLLSEGKIKGKSEKVVVPKKNGN